MEERRSPTPAAVRKRTAIRCLQKALEQERLCLHYQPIVDAQGACVERVEALLRWRPLGPPPGTECPQGPQAESLTELLYAVEDGGPGGEAARVELTELFRAPLAFGTPVCAAWSGPARGP